MRVLSIKVLRDFWSKYPDCEQQLKTWYRQTELSDWKSSHDIKLDYPSASIIGNERVVFNIKGNRYRLIIKVDYDHHMIWIRFIGTHRAYDKINAENI